MRRRKFITLLGGAAAAWPLASHAQQGGRMRRIGVLMPLAADDPMGQARIAALREGLEKLGWTEGRNIRIDTRWTTTGEVESMQRFAKELVALQPDLIVTQSTPITATSSFANRCIDSASLVVAQRVSIRILRPSVQPSFSSPSRKAAMRACPTGSSAVSGMITPTRRIRSPCCARAESGQATAAPPRSVMNSRRVTRSPRRRARAMRAAPLNRAPWRSSY